MSEEVTKSQSWVGFGPAGAVGSIHRTAEGFGLRMTRDAEFRGVYPSLEIAKRALHTAMPAGSDRPEIHEH